MSISSAITAAQGRVADCYTAISNKGGTLPATQNLANMPTAIGSISTGGTIDSLSITPSTSAQTITATGGIDGYSPISVSAVTSSIDANITAGNIKSGVSILGVSGSLTPLIGETRSVSITSTAGNTFTPTSGKNGITSITVTPTNQAKTITPTTSSQSISVPSGYSGFGTLTVNAVTSSIDANITAGNIKDGVTILGVTGTYSGGGSFTGINRSVSQSGVYQQPSESFSFSLPSGATNLSGYCLYYAFYYCTGMTSINLSSLTSISNQNAFYSGCNGCTNLTSANISSLATVSGSYAMYNGFYGCTKLTSIDFSSLTTISGSYAFGNICTNCTSLKSISFPSLTSITGANGLSGSFWGCSKLASVSFPSLTTVSGNSAFASAFRENVLLKTISFPNLSSLTGSEVFLNCFQGSSGKTTSYDISFNSLTTNSFGSNTNQFRNMFNTYTRASTTTVHFPSNLQTKVSSLTGYPTFGGNSSYISIAFDLPATS